MSNILVITANEREKLNKKMKRFGLFVEGGSVDYDTEMAWVSLKNNVATYSQRAVATILGAELEVSKVVLDGCLYAIPA